MDDRRGEVERTLFSHSKLWANLIRPQFGCLTVRALALAAVGRAGAGGAARGCNKTMLRQDSRSTGMPSAVREALPTAASRRSAPPQHGAGRTSSEKSAFAIPDHQPRANFLAVQDRAVPTQSLQPLFQFAGRRQEGSLAPTLGEFRMGAQQQGPSCETMSATRQTGHPSEKAFRTGPAQG